MPKRIERHPTMTSIEYTALDDGTAAPCQGARVWRITWMPISVVTGLNRVVPCLPRNPLRTGPVELFWGFL
jgi:hypothetical protein